MFKGSFYEERIGAELQLEKRKNDDIMISVEDVKQTMKEVSFSVVEKVKIEEY